MKEIYFLQRDNRSNQRQLLQPRLGDTHRYLPPSFCQSLPSTPVLAETQPLSEVPATPAGSRAASDS